MAIRNYWLLFSLGIVVLVNFAGMLIVRRSPKSILENRQLTVRLQSPKSLLRSPMWLKESLAPFLQDTFLYREASIKLNRGIKLAVRDEPNNDVWTGKKGWLYLASPLVAARVGPYGDPYSDMFGDKSKHDAAIEFARITRLVDICKKSGSKLIVLYPPNKETIYPEFLATQPPSKKSALDELEAKLTTLPVQVIRVKSGLLTAKSDNGNTNLFYQFDTHWNYYGASLIAVNLIDLISELSGFHVHQPVFTIEQSGLRISDLAVMNQSLSSEPEYIVKFRGSHGHKFIDRYGKVPDCIQRSRKSPKVLVFRDSFFAFLQPYFMHSNVDMTTCRNGLSFEDIELKINAEKPNVVIFERLERFIGD